MGLMNYSRTEVLENVESGKITICVIGLGRVGLPTASAFAKAGAKVIGADINRELVNLVNSGKCPFVDELGLGELVERVVKKGNLRATTDVSGAVGNSDAIVVCVPTPVDEQKVPDYSAIEKACKATAKNLK
ncbi:MAG: NAD(P)-binding domain-containing protein, partial [Candidatus Bathyarchaeia archaeon]